MLTCSQVLKLCKYYQLMNTLYSNFFVAPDKIAGNYVPVMSIDIQFIFFNITH